MASKTTAGMSNTRKTTELLIVTRNELGALAKITTPLARNNINIECFTGYEWGGEAAFRFVTDNNKKARDLLKAAGYNVVEGPVTVWQMSNTPGMLMAATTSLAEANVNTFCAYSTASADDKTVIAVFNTNNSDRATDVLRKVRC